MANSVSPAAAGSSESMFQCGVAAYGVVEAALAALPALREQPGRPSGRQIPPRFLRHADEQTVVGLAAVLRAIDEHHLQQQCFDDWGVLAASHFPGRMAGAAALTRFQREGPVAISPHIIPQYSLHSVSSAISIALGMHGPSFGIGGGPEALAEGLTVALSFLDHGGWPGLWLVLTQWTPEPVPDGLGSTTVDAVCRGVALGLVPGHGQGGSLRLASREADRFVDGLSGAADRVPAAATLSELAGRLAQSPPSCQPAPWLCPLPWGGQIELIIPQQRLAKAA